MIWAEKIFMPEKETIEKARKDKRQGKSASTQAGEFVREEFHHIREGKHGARSKKQAVAIGLSKARRAGVKLAPPSPGRSSPKARRQAKRDYEKGQRRASRAASPQWTRIVFGILRGKGLESASAAISRQARAAAKRGTPRKTARTKGTARKSAAGKKTVRKQRG